MSNNTAYYHRAFRDVLDYFYANKIPVNLVYSDNTEKVVFIINYNEYNIICQDLEGEDSFAISKHILKNRNSN